MAAVLVIAAGNTLAPLTAHMLLRRARFRNDLAQVRDCVALVTLGAMAAMLISATVGGLTLLAAGVIPVGAFWSTWSVWWAGDAMGVLVVTPLLLAARSARGSIATPKRWLEAAALVTGLSLVILWVLLGRIPLLFLFVPFLVWGAWRFGLLVATSAALLSSVSVTLAAAHGRPPFANLTTAERMVTLLVFNGSIALITMMVASAMTERRRSQWLAESAVKELDEKVQERTSELADTNERLRRSEEMLTDAQRIGQVGSWERDLTTNEVIWSDQLYRLYGHEPHSFTIDYQTFLDHIHPDDRAAVMASNSRAIDERGVAELDHRVVWPDGSVHWLHRRGVVVVDDTGAPIKMVGTAQEITSAKLAADTLRSSEEYLRTLMALIPEAMVGVDADGRIVIVNEQAEKLFGYPAPEIVGKPVETLMAPRHHEQHKRHRMTFLVHPRSRPMGAGLDLYARRRDGSEFPADIALGPLRTVEPRRSAVVVATVRDVTERRQAEASARQLREAGQRRQQALEINDNVIQGMSASLYALQREDEPHAITTLQRTLSAARQMMTNLLGIDTDVEPKDLIRRQPASLPGKDLPPPPQPVPRPDDHENGIRIVLADDSPHIRFALSAYLDSLNGVTLVGKATDGAGAVRLVAHLRPDLVLLDLAMPVLDGLDALTQIHRMFPDTKVIVLSGYGREHAATQAINRGAVGYVEKGGSTHELTALLTRLFPGVIGRA